MEQFIVFVDNQQKFALDIAKVERIIEFGKTKKIPESSEYLLGIIQYNGQILPIIDLKKRLYNIFSEELEGSKTIVVLWKNKFIGFVVDDVLGIHKFDSSMYEQSSQEASISKDYIRGYIKSEDDITIVIDTDKIFDNNQEKELLMVAED